MFSIKFKGYKNFSKQHFVGLDDIKKINIIIGKNNIGKTALLESVKAVQSINELKLFSKKVEGLYFRYRIRKEDITKMFQSNFINDTYTPPRIFFKGRTYSFRIHDLEYFEGETILFKAEFESMQHLIQKNEWRLSKITDVRLASDNYNEFFSKNNIYKESLHAILADFLMLRFNKMNYPVTQLSADRDLKPEKPSNNLEVYPDGTGATNIIQNYLNKADRDSNVVEVDILNALNKIMTNDIEFSRISIQDVSNDDGPQHWEIFLHEEGKLPIALSDSGSGLRTVLLVLVKLILECDTAKTNIVIFEELENNLHPAIQRNLHRYIFQWAKEHDQFVFITTHSNVPIDMVLQEVDAQLVHVFKKDNLVHTATLLSSLDSDHIFNDLEIKASDLLQSNGIVWVEGPSDRVYINKWIELMTDGELVEHKHYQIMFYGGKLLSHLSGDSNFEKLIDHEKTDLIKLFLTNRNSAIVIDSDRDAPRKHINQTKKRIEKEFKDKNKFVWVTDGREIENYLSENTVNSLYEVKRAIGKYEIIGEYLTEQGNKDNYSNQKPAQARKLIEHMDENDLIVLDLKIQVGKLVDEIKKWNNL